MRAIDHTHGGGKGNRQDRCHNGQKHLSYDKKLEPSRTAAITAANAQKPMLQKGASRRKQDTRARESLEAKNQSLHRQNLCPFPRLLTSNVLLATKSRQAFQSLHVKYKQRTNSRRFHSHTKRQAQPSWYGSLAFLDSHVIVHQTVHRHQCRAQVTLVGRGHPRPKGSKKQQYIPGSK